MSLDIVVNTPSIVVILIEHPIEMKHISIKPSQFLFLFSCTSANWRVRAGVDYAA